MSVEPDRQEVSGSTPETSEAESEVLDIDMDEDSDASAEELCDAILSAMQSGEPIVIEVEATEGNFETIDARPIKLTSEGNYRYELRVLSKNDVLSPQCLDLVEALLTSGHHSEIAGLIDNTTT